MTEYGDRQYDGITACQCTALRKATSSCRAMICDRHLVDEEVGGLVAAEGVARVPRVECGWLPAVIDREVETYKYD